MTRSLTFSMLAAMVGFFTAVFASHDAVAGDGYFPEVDHSVDSSFVRFASAITDSASFDCADSDESSADCDVSDSSGRDDSDGCGCSCCGRCCPDPWVVAREPLFCESYLDWLSDLGNIERCRFKMPITGGAWHWFHESLIGRSGGYGIDGLRGTYFWYVFADPEYDLGCGKKVGGHVELRLRETDTFRSFIDDQVWTWELYGYLQDEDWGTLKAGQLYTRFGLFWDGVFFGNAPYFDGLKLDADWGVSWEKTTEIHDCLKLDSYVQFFFHEDQSNGSFGGGDAESVSGYTEKNTAIVRVVPTWTRADGSQIALGISGLVGQIDSTIALPDETVSAYALDLTYTKGPWKMFVEGSQTFGVRNPVRYVSGGPSDRLTNILTGLQYTHGAMTYRCSYSNSIDDNPHAVQHMIDAGVTATLTKHVDMYLEYVNQRVSDATVPGQNGYFFNGIEYVINWHF